MRGRRNEAGEGEMVLVLPQDHRARADLAAAGVRCLSEAEARALGLRPRRVGIINLMPKAQDYEEMLLGALAQGPYPPGLAVQPIWIRLLTHAYSSSDADYLRRFYTPFAQALAGDLDGLILTGAPVEELAFSEVRYWDELVDVLHTARREIPSTLGLCWGAMALAKLLGLEKEALERKLFGCFAFDVVQPGHPTLARAGRLWCPQSRHSGTSSQALEEAARAGSVVLLGHAPETGYTLFESADRRFLMHQGHPEYRPERLVFEYQRDRALGRADVGEPVAVDLSRPAASPPSHGPDFFAGWLSSLAPRDP